jgi:hypothetical protein
MEAWMYATRIPEVTKPGFRLDGTHTKQQFDAQIPAHVRWKADNYNHLLEQPTQFYAVGLVLALLGANSRLDVGLAWGYVALRVLHSLEQARTNNILRRFKIFVSSSAVLLGLTARAAWLLWTMA